jgi:hypothetical protein
LGSEEDEWKLEDPNLPYSPWWFTSDPTRGIGFRVLRPLKAPADKAMRLKAWEADAEDILDGVENRMQEGRGAVGLVDPDLPKAIEELKKSK